MKKIDSKKLYDLLYKEFVSKNDNAYNISCVKHENGCLYASDAHILAKVEYDYPPEMDGKAFDINGNQIAPKVNYDAVIPAKSGYDHYLTDEEVNNIKIAAKKVYRVGKGNFKAVIDIGLPHMNKGEKMFIITFKAAYLNSAFKLFNIIGDNPKIRICNSHTPIIIFEGIKSDTIILCMPTLSDVNEDTRVYPKFTIQDAIKYEKPQKEKKVWYE
jgi:hypothetical protein